MAISPNGKFLYAILEGATVADTDQLRRYIFEFSIKDEAFTGRTWQYHVENIAHLVADMAALSEHRLVLIERDGGRGLTALFRNVYVIDLRDVDAAGFVEKDAVVDLTKIPDPNLVSLPEIHPGDLGLGDPFWVMCESVEAIHPSGHDRIVRRLRQQPPQHRPQPSHRRRQRVHRRRRPRPRLTPSPNRVWDDRPCPPPTETVCSIGASPLLVVLEQTVRRFQVTKSMRRSTAPTSSGRRSA